MSKRLTAIIFILILLGLSACVRSSSGGDASRPSLTGMTSTGPVTQPAASISLPNATETAAASSTPALGPTPTQEDLETNPAPGVTETSGAPSAEVMRTLAIMPLEAGSSWVYSNEAYSGDEKATWRISDTVVDNLIRPPFFAAKIQREVTLLSGSPTGAFINPPKSENFWYLVDGSRVYRQEEDQAEALSWNGLDSLILEFVFPLSTKADCWYPDPGLRRETPAPGALGCRQSGDGASQKFPAGTLDHCHLLKTSDNNGTEKLTFCDGVGMAESSFDHQGTRFGEHFVLTGYLVQTP